MGLFDSLKKNNTNSSAIEEAYRIRKENEKDALYQFEHDILPRLFYSDTYRLLEVLIRSNNCESLYDLYSGVCDDMHQQAKFDKNSFDVSFLYREDAILCKILFPEPYSVSLCSCAYLMTDLDGVATKYFTIEKALKNKEDDPGAYICSWTNEHKHTNHMGMTRLPDKSGIGTDRLNELFFGNPIDAENVNSFDELSNKVKQLIPTSKFSVNYIK